MTLKIISAISDNKHFKKIRYRRKFCRTKGLFVWNRSNPISDIKIFLMLMFSSMSVSASVSMFRFTLQEHENEQRTRSRKLTWTRKRTRTRTRTRTSTFTFKELDGGYRISVKLLIRYPTYIGFCRLQSGMAGSAGSVQYRSSRILDWVPTYGYQHLKIMFPGSV